MQRLLKLNWCLLLVMILLCAGLVHAKEVTPEKVQMIEDYVQTHLDKFGIPGMSVVIVSDGQVVFSEGFGLLEKGQELKVDVNTLFQIASVSKSFTALAIMQLKDRGLLDTDDLVTKYLPWYASKDNERSAKITIKNLLQHTSGIPTQAYGLEIKNGTMDQLEEQVKRLSKITLIAEPGTRHQYSNLNYWTLALIIEKVSGLKFADYMEQNVFIPLGMERTCYINQIPNVDNVATGHRLSFGKSKPFDYSIPGTTIAAGGIYTSAADMSRYILFLLNKGKSEDNVILSETAYNELFTGGAKVWQDVSYGYGWFIYDDKDSLAYEHGGDNPNYTAELVISPDSNLGIAVLSNSQHTLTHLLGNRLYNFLQSGEEMPVIQLTGVERGLQPVRLAYLGTFILLLILAFWALIVGLGIKKGKYVIFQEKPGIIRLIIQVCLTPLVGLVIGIYCFTLPAKAIGSLRIALLYQGDLVRSVLLLASTLIIFCAFVGVMGFVKKAAKLDPVKTENS